jgi:hypothetical protein
MKLTKAQYLMGMIFILIFWVTLPGLAAPEKGQKAGKGYLELKATIPDWVENDIVIGLLQEDGTTTQVMLHPEEQFENIVKLPVGSYVIEYVELVGVPTSDYLVEFQQKVVIEKDKGVAYGIRVRDRSSDDEAEDYDKIGTPIKTNADNPDRDSNAGKTAQGRVEQNTAGEDEEEEQNQQTGDSEEDGLPESSGDAERPLSIKEMMDGMDSYFYPSDNSQAGQDGAGGEANNDGKKAGKKQNLGIIFLKKNWFTFLLVIVICVVTVVIKKKQDDSL